MTETSSRDAAYFDRLYATNPDPWNFTGSDYERRKYDATIAALGGRHFAAGLEVGCSIGVLTARLAAHCDALLGLDLAAQALAEAARRCAALDHVRFESRRVPEEWPPGRFDLIVLSEVLYFFTPTDNARVAAAASASISPGGLVVLVNFLEDIAEPCSGQQAAELFIAAAAPTLRPVLHQPGGRFRIDVLQAIN